MKYISFPTDADFSKNQRLLLPNIAIDLVLTTNSNKFAVISNTEDDKYDILFKECYLMLATCELDSNIQWGISETLSNGGVCRYYYPQGYIKKFGISKGDFSFSKPNLFEGSKLPSKFYVVMMSSEKCDSPKHNSQPLEFKSYGIKKIECRLDNQNIGQTYENIDFNNSKYLQLYSGYVNTLDSSKKPVRFLTHKKYGKKCIMGFTLSQSGKEGYITESRKGNVSLEITLNSGASESINLYIFYKKYHLCSVSQKDPENLEITDTEL